MNHGNFLAILKLLSEHDEIVTKLNGPKNVPYTHHSIQNDLIDIMATKMRRDISDEISAAGCSSTAVDKSKDCSKTEQLSS